MTRALIVAAALLVVVPARAQSRLDQVKIENLQFFPKDISREQLVQRMREFSFALNVRCQYCHTGGDGISFDGVNFASDEKPAKVKARTMLRMVDHLNSAVLPQLPSRAEPRVEVTCVTCHRGLALPKSLQTTLLEVIDKNGIPAAVARYRSLRQDTLVFGRYNFDEWEMNELARRLFEAKKTDAAIAMLELNGEFNPKSAAIDFQLGELHRMRGERDRAIQRYRSALAKAPKHEGVIQRLAELEKKQD
ncbi:MAG: c-type cytochrome [Vicinamibacterales bacterium]